MALLPYFLAVVISAELIGLVQLSRHGLRTPIGRPLWAYPESADPGSLTPAGQAQQYAHGLALRLNYSSLLGDFYSPRLVYARATAYNRTVASVNSQLMAIYAEDSEFEIRTAGKREDVILLPHLACPLITHIMDSKMLVTEPHAKLLQRIKELKSDVLKLVSDLDFLRVFDVSEVLVNYFDRGIAPPCSQDMLNLAKAVYDHGNTYLLYGDEEQRKLGASLLLGEVIGRFQALLAGRNAPVISLYAGHDISLIPVLLTLGVEEVPEIAAFLTFELHTDSTQGFVRVKFNGEERNLTICPSPCNFHDFVSALETRIYMKVEDWVEKCNSTKVGVGRIYIVLMGAGGVVIVAAVWKRWKEIVREREKKE